MKTIITTLFCISILLGCIRTSANTASWQNANAAYNTTLELLSAIGYNPQYVYGATKKWPNSFEKLDAYLAQYFPEIRPVFQNNPTPETASGILAALLTQLGMRLRRNI